MPFIVRRSIRYRSTSRSSGTPVRSPTRDTMSVPQSREPRARSLPPSSVSSHKHLSTADVSPSGVGEDVLPVVPNPHPKDPAKNQSENHASNGPLLVSVDFKISSPMEGAYFLQYARDICDRLQLKGWVMNLGNGAVIGRIEGEKSRVDEMTLWLKLRDTSSCSQHTQFTDRSIIDTFHYDTFTVRL